MAATDERAQSGGTSQTLVADVRWRRRQAWALSTALAAFGFLVTTAITRWNAASDTGFAVSLAACLMTLLLSIARMLRTGVREASEGVVVVVNPFRTYRVALTDIKSFGATRSWTAEKHLKLIRRGERARSITVFALPVDGLTDPEVGRELPTLSEAFAGRLSRPL